MKEFLKVGISGVRGIVGDSFTPQLAAAFSQAFGSFVGRGPVIVGRDTRRSGPMIELAVTAGLQSVGCRPILAGIVPTPTLLILTRVLHARGAIAITASHNPAQWNALKFVDHSGLFLSPHKAEQLFDIYHQGGFHLVPEEEISQVTQHTNPTSVHFERVLQYVDVEAIRKKKFKVAADYVNGVGCLHTRGFLEELGCEVVSCFDDPARDFEREPEPLPENLKTLSALVAQEACDVGFAQDPDADRLAIVDETGTPIGEDLSVALAAHQVLEHHQKGPIVVHLSTSRCVQDVATAHGVDFIHSKIGEIHVTEKMIEVGAAVGGEGNGGVIIPAIHPCRDSFAGMAIILELMALSGKTVSELRAQLPRYAVIKDKIPMPAEKTPALLRALRKDYEGHKISLLDGVHVDLGNAWFHVRMSNTEPVVRFVAEAASQEAVEEIIAALKKRIVEFV